MNSTSLVIPAHNCAATIRECLEAVVPLLRGPFGVADGLTEVIVVDDRSTDDTRPIASEFPVRLIQCTGRGPGAARNTGWRTAQGEYVWFIDSDCVAEPDALALLLPHMSSPTVAGVGGSYGIMNPHSLLARLIHEEIVERHRSMPTRVNFLATFNVLYRRSVLSEVGGFDERYLKAQDAELAFRIIAAGHDLAFERESRVKHYHPTALRGYLRTQRQQGYWRVWLHAAHRGHALRDSYSSWIDHIQPILAVGTVASIVPALLRPPALWWLPGAGALALALAQLPLVFGMVRRTRRLRNALFALMGMVRALWRGAGLLQGVLAITLRARRSHD